MMVKSKEKKEIRIKKDSLHKIKERLNTGRYTRAAFKSNPYNTRKDNNQSIFSHQKLRQSV